MKKIIYLFVLAIGFTSCSVESIDSGENLETADASAKLNATYTSSMTFLEEVCAGEETEITVDFEQRTNPQGKNLSTNIKVDLYIDGEWVEIYQENLNNVTTTSFNYTFEEATDYSLRYSAENGPWNDPQILTVKDCCTESFTYVANADGTYTFTYTAGEDMVNAELVFTFAQASYISGLGDDFSQNGEGQTYKAVMDLEKCEVLEYIVELDPKCSGNSETSNVWTDFTVNKISQKADEEDKFTVSCS